MFVDSEKQFQLGLRLAEIVRPEDVDGDFRKYAGDPVAVTIFKGEED